jgi:hypothetical protein
MPNNKKDQQSRTSRRMNTKSPMHKRCQGRTKGTLARARQPHKGTGARDWFARLPYEAGLALAEAALVGATTGTYPIEVTPEAVPA